MPGFTPRGYPYPIPADPMDGPGDLQDLAEAWDADLTTVSNTISTRPSFRVFSSTPQNLLVAFASAFTLSFESIDYNNGGAFAPTSGASQSTITPLLPGFWWLTAACSYARPALTPAPNFDEFGISIQSGATVYTKRNTHSEPVAGEPRTLSVGTGVFLDGVTPIQAVFTANRVSAIQLYTVYNRSFTGFRMTES